MGAIFGIFHFDKQPISRVLLENMGEVLRPYGPEGRGIWVDEYYGFGQCLIRFMPEDSYEQQSLSNSERKLVYNGFLSNRIDIIRKLNFSTSEAEILPDSALVFKAYKKWGTDCLRDLMGDFTFALWDNCLKQLLIVRSAVHAPPLFYHMTPKTLAFASMRKGLFTLPHIPRKLDEQVMADYLTGAPIDPDLGFYQEIKRMPTGHLLRINLDGVQIKRFWQLDLTKTINFPSEADYSEAFNELFTKVVAENLRSSTPLGIMMSGGLDSSSVAAIAADLLKTHNKHLTAFTEVPERNFVGPIIKGRYADETPYVQAIAAMYDNLCFKLIRTDGQVYLDDLDSFFDAAEVPFRNASNRVYIEAILKTAQDMGIRNLLTGGQGNLTISWKGSGLIPQLIQQGQLRRAFLEARALTEHGYHKSVVFTLFSQGLMPLLSEPMWVAIQYLLKWDPSTRKAFNSKTPWQVYSPIHPDFAKYHNIYNRALEKGHNFLFHQKISTRKTRVSAIENTASLLDGLEIGYQKLFGVTTRDPTADQRLVEFCLRLPEDQYLNGGISKWLIRNVMQGRLPEKVIWNKKRGLQAADWYFRLVGAKPKILAALDRIENSDLASRVIDVPRLHRLVDAMPSTLSTSVEPQVLMRDYRQVLESGLMTGSFLVWFENGLLK